MLIGNVFTLYASGFNGMIYSEARGKEQRICEQQSTQMQGRLFIVFEDIGLIHSNKN